MVQSVLTVWSWELEPETISLPKAKTQISDGAGPNTLKPQKDP